MSESEIRTVAVIGAGVIGNGWAAHLLAQGLQVRVTDPADGAEQRLHRDIELALPALQRLGRDTTGWRERLTFTASIGAAVEGADFVQENGPEPEELKAPLLAEIDAATAGSTVIASSSSGMLPSRMAAMCARHPERMVVGHPFNPVYLIPLVEVVGGPDTAPAVVEQALGFYAAIGKRPIHVRQELPGHLANRLQAALWREAYSLVERGVASVADIDTAIAYGPGLRWALLGPLVNQHLSGGDGGLAHILEHLGPPTQRWMDDLGAPQLNPALAEALVSGVNAELDGIDVRAMVAERDALLIDLLTAKARAQALP
jgi:carnitine 3-dehydrogenase